MRIEFDDGTLLLPRCGPDNVPYAEWDDRVDEYRTQAYRYRALLEWAGAWSDGDEQATLHDGFAPALEDAARAYPDLDLTPALHIEPRGLPTSRPPSTPGSTTTAGAASSSPRAAGRRSSASKPSLTPRQRARRHADDRSDESVARHAHQRLW